MEARAYLMQLSSSESEDSDSNASSKPAGPLNTKKFPSQSYGGVERKFLQSRATVYSQKNGGAEAAENEHS